jgi:Reverse transcriptase (RNA-dependent DNA polymerase)
MLSNLVLDELDRELDRRGRRFVRYADDCNIYVRGEKTGRRVMASLTRFIERRLKLQIDTEKSAVAPPWHRSFRGFTVKDDPVFRRCIAEGHGPVQSHPDVALAAWLGSRAPRCIELTVAGGPRVRSSLPPADSPFLTGSSAPRSRTPAFARVCGLWEAARDRGFEARFLQRRDGMGQAARRWHHRRCSQPMECPDAPAERPRPAPGQALSRSLVALDQDSTIIAVVELSQSSWLVAGRLPGIERQPRKKLEPSAERLLGLLHRWRDEAVKAGRKITRIALAFEAGRTASGWRAGSRLAG